MTEGNQYRPPRTQVLRLLAGVALIGSISMLLSPILDDVARGLATSTVSISYAIAAYNGATALSALSLAPRIDRLGEHRAMRLGLLCLTAALIVSAAARNWLMLAVGQGIAGLGAGLILPATYGLAIQLASPGLGSRVLGRVLAGWSIALIAGVPVSGFVTRIAGWRSVYLLLIPVVVALLVLPQVRAPGGAAQPSRPATISPFAALRIKGIPALLSICAAFMASFYGVYAFLGDHARASLRLTAVGTSLIVLAYGVGFGAGGRADGLLDRVGPRRLFPLALATLALIYGWLPTVSAHLAGLLALCLIWGMVNHAGLNMLVQLLGQAKPEAWGTILGLNSAVTYVGATLGVGISGWIAQRGGFDQIAYAASATMAGAWMVSVAGVRFAPGRSVPELG